MSVNTQLAEFRSGWRALLAAALGLSSGMTLHPFVINVLAPYLVEGLGWTRSEFALAGLVSGLAIFAYPIVGRLADRYGARRVGAVGVVATSASYVAIALLEGPIHAYFAILVLQIMLGTMTTGPVFLRLVVRGFDASRGKALAIAVSSPAIVAALASPLLGAFIEREGWRMGSLAVAIYGLVAGCTALLLIPRGFGGGDDIGGGDGGGKAFAATGGGLKSLFANGKYRLLLAVTMLASLPIVLTNSQLGLVLMDNGMHSAETGWMLSLFAAGTIVGRLAGGLALDRFAANKVGAITFILPALGMLLLASSFDQHEVLAMGILLIGLAFGAEGDILAFFVSRLSGLESYGMALGIVFATVGLAAMLGAILLNQVLALWEGYAPFLVISSLAVALASAMMLVLLKLDGAPEASAA